MKKFNHLELLGRIKACGYTQEKLAGAIGINLSTLNSKLNGQSYFSTKEMDSICKELDISTGDIGKYFFAH